MAWRNSASIVYCPLIHIRCLARGTRVLSEGEWISMFPSETAMIRRDVRSRHRQSNPFPCTPFRL